MWSPDQGHYESAKENSEILAKSDHGKWYGPRTPTIRTRSRSGSPQESPRLSLALFAKTPRISMGKVKIGHSKIKRIVVENPMSVAQSLHLHKNSEKKGFTLLMPVDRGQNLRINPEGTYEVLPSGDEFTVPAMSEVDLPILWKPDAEGSYRETITLKLGDLNRLHLIVFGNAVDAAPKPKHKMKTLLPEFVRKGHLPSQKRKISATEKVLTSKKVLQESNKGLPQPSNKVVFDVSVTSKGKSEKQGKGTEKKRRTFKTKVAVKGVAQSRLTLIKKTMEESRNIPRHPLPYVAKNMYFDEKWIEKQERGFVQWLNYILTPPDELTSFAPLETSSLFLMEHASQEHSQPLAPTKEVLSFRAYTAKRKMARLRRSACLLYESQPLALVARTIESEIERSRLCIRPDKHFPQDLGIKETIVKMLLSYNSLWLRIGLETIYGEILPLQSNDDVVGLKRFLKSRFLVNPDIAKEYRHATVAEYYKPGYFEALSKFTLKKFLLLVLFLDKAKLTRLIDHDPCLFNKNAHYKCNRDLLLTFSRDYLKGEGDITKHLSFLNYTVSHVQAPLDEMDYAVTNLAVDLRDGLRITRVIELLTQNWTFSSFLRVPAISRLQKIHNVSVALNALKERGVFEDEKSNVDPRHIVDGHREKTLSFLWSIILHFQVNLVVNEKQIEEEISFLRKYHYEKNLERVSCSRVHDRQEPTEEQDIYFNSKKLRLLLEWCRSVCRLYGVKVDNFTVSMSDGRVLCYLVHCYHPCLLKEEEICQDTTQTCNSYIAEEDSLNDSLNDSLKNDGTGYGGRLEELKKNERKNHKLCRDKVQELGGVPSILTFTDMSSTIPDEKVVITYVSYLCARLLDLREEGRAARIIQLAWRKYCLKKRLYELQKKTTAALVIQKYFRSFQEKKQEEIKLQSTLIIQAFCRGYQARRHLRRRHSAAAVIQSTYRSFIAMKEIRSNYQNLKGATLRLQALVRRKISREKVKRMIATRVIQCNWRRYLARDRFLRLKNATIVLQAVTRRFLARRFFKSLRAATVIIQRRYKALRIGRKTKEDYTKLRKAVTMLQARRRGTKARREVRQLRAVVVLQKTVRMWQCRHEFLERKKRIIKVQSLVRRIIARRKYKKYLSSARVIQQRWRAQRLGSLGRSSYLKLKASAVTIQSFYRSRIARRRFLSTRKAAIVIQAGVRGLLARKELERWRESCCVIQTHFRAYLLMKETRNEFRKKKETAIKLQAFYRGRRSRVEYLRERKAVVSAQAKVRAQLARKRYLRMKSAVRILERRYLALKTMRCQRKCYLETCDAIVTLQASFRGHLVREQLKKMNTAATLIQTNYRRCVARARYLHVQRCIAVIQNRYRAWSVGKQVAEDYQKLRNAVLVIQRCSRGSAVRKEVQTMSLAAVKIQATFRGYHTKKSYSKLRISVLTIQRSYRSLLKTRTTREDYVTKRACVILLQSALRRVLCVRQFQRERNAAQVIQTRWRALVVSRETREEYHCVRNSIITIQAFSRGLKARREVRRERATIKVQSVWRGVVQRRCFLRLREAAVVIQACFRMVMTRRRYVVLKDLVVALQRKVRANQLCVRQKASYEITRGAIITLQAALRGYRTRNELRRTKEATIKIQSSFRRHRARQEYLKIRRNVAMLQRRRRAIVIGRRTRSGYQNLKRSVVLLQSRVRCRVARREFQESREKIVKLQAAVRGFLARSEYQRKRQAAMVIQQRHRAYVMGSAWCVWYNIQKGACITIQAYIKAWIQRRRYSRQRQAAQVIQVYYAAWSTAKKQKCEYQKLRSAVVSIQAYTRGWSVRRHLEKSRAATRIQSWWKMCRAREEYARERRCVVRVQSVARAWLAKRRYESLRRAVMGVQRRFRANRLCRKERDVFLEKKGSCLLIQHCYRFYRQRRLVQIMLRSVSGTRAAVVVLQRRYRAQLLMRHHRQSYLVQRSAAVTLQATYRGYQGRVLVAKLRAVVVIQSYYRGYRQRCEYKKLRYAVVKLQARARGKHASVAYGNLRRAAVVVQRRERARVQGNSERKLFLGKRDSAMVIQRYLRGYQERTRYHKLRTATIKLQALVRSKLAHDAYTALRMSTVIIQRRQRATVLGICQRIAFLKQKESAVLIQSWLRGNHERTRFLKLKNAAVRIQAWVRGRRARVAFEKARRAAVVIQRRERARVVGKTQRNFFLKQRKSAVLIQSYVRRRQQRTRYLELRRVITKIQARVRGRRACIAYRKLREAAIVIQQRARAIILGKTARNFYLTQRKSAVLIQSWLRGYNERENVRRIRAAQLIQKRYRACVKGRSARDDFVGMRMAAVTVQSWYRGHLARKRFKAEKAARVIQARVRGHQTRAKVEKIKKEKAARLVRFSAAVYINLATIRLQRAYRKAKAIALFKAKMDRLLFLQRWWRARLVRLHFLRVRHLVCVMQTRWRARFTVKNQAAAKIQALVRTVLAKRAAERRRKAIVTIQSVWRGYHVRKQSSSGKIKKARQRIRVANANVTERMKLCNRTRSALDYLLNCKNLSTVLGALINLEIATRLSHRCTEQLVSDNALSVIFKVVRNSNRSLAHIELIKHALGIFINVSKCPTTQGVVVTREPDSLDTLVELACIFREKPEIFSRVCILLTLLCGNEAIRKNLLSMEKVVSKIKSVYTLSKRKYDIDFKRNNAKCKQVSLTCRDTKKKTNKNNTESSPLSAITTLVDVLGLVFK